MSIGDTFKKGSIWTIGMIVVGMGLTYLRNLCLSHADPTGYLMGAISIAFVYVNLILNFGSLGCVMMLTKFLPEIGNPADRFKLTTTSILIQVPLAAISMGILLWLPPEYTGKLGLSIVSKYPEWILVLTIFTLLASWIGSVLPGIMKFGANAKVTVITPLSLFVVSVAALAFPDTVRNNIFPIVFSCLIFAAITMFAYTLWIAKNDLKPVWGFYTPKGYFSAYFWFTAFGIISFAAMNLSQLFVSSYLGLEALGIYFLFQQIAMLSNLAVQKLSAPMLATFSKILKDEGESENSRLSTVYQKLCRKMNIISFLSVIAFISFNKLIGLIFGQTFAEHSYVLIILSLGLCMANTNNILQQIIFAKGWIAANVCVFIIVSTAYFGMLYFTIHEYRLVSASVGYSLYCVLRYVLMLSYIYAKTKDIDFFQKSSYWYSLIITLPVGIFFLFVKTDLFFIPATVSIVASLLYLKLIHFKITEIFEILPKSAVQKAEYVFAKLGLYK